jgi:hypothetical protein
MGRRAIVLAVLLATSLASPAAPARPEPSRIGGTFEVDGWIGTAFRDEAGLAFCTVGTSFASGLDLHLTLAGDRLTLFLAHAGWRLEPGAAWPVAIAVDALRDRPSDRHVARAVEAHMVGIALGHGWLGRLRDGKTLRLEIGARVLAFDLEDARSGLDALESCLDGHGR